MFNSVLAKVTDLFNKQVLTTVFFPSLVFWIALVAIGLVGADQLATVVEAWNDQDVIVQALQTVGFLALVAFFALLIASQLYGLLRFYEGYSPPLPVPIKTWGTNWYKNKLKELKDEGFETYPDIYRGYPWREADVMPTRLGNVLKSAEVYPMQRYKVDAVLSWPRLYGLLPDASTTQVAQLRASMETMLVVSFLGAFFGLSSGALLIVLGGQWWLFLVCLLGGFVVSWLAYRGAVAVAMLYAEQIRVTFDLHRKLLLEKMGAKVPERVSDEREQWDKLNKFLYRNAAPNWDVPEQSTGEAEAGELAEQKSSEEEPCDQNGSEQTIT